MDLRFEAQRCLGNPGRFRLHLLGTHGTSRSRAEAIVASRQFIPTGEDGHAGAGIYFWSYIGNIKLAKHLATMWWHFYNKKNQYVGDADPSCAVIDVTICHPGQSAYVDATGEEFREALAELVDVLDGTQDFSFLKETGYLFKELEKKSGEPILVAKVLLGMPKTNGIPSIVVRDFPMAPAYIVRRGGEALIEDCRITA